MRRKRATKTTQERRRKVARPCPACASKTERFDRELCAWVCLCGANAIGLRPVARDLTEEGRRRSR